MSVGVLVVTWARIVAAIEDMPRRSVLLPTEINGWTKHAPMLRWGDVENEQGHRRKLRLQEVLSFEA